jgi:hypothetical protein
MRQRLIEPTPPLSVVVEDGRRGLLSTKVIKTNVVAIDVRCSRIGSNLSHAQANDEMCIIQAFVIDTIHSRSCPQQLSVERKACLARSSMSRMYCHS